MPSYYDISRRLVTGTAVWPGDTPYNVERTQRIAKGDAVNLSTLHLSAHTGTHVDAPYHFNDGDETVDELSLAPYWGRAQVVAITKETGPLIPEDFQDYDLKAAPRLLLRSRASSIPFDTFPSQYSYPSPELANFLGSKGIILLGTDAPSMDPENSIQLEGHHALRRNKIAILEWLNLSEVPEGVYQLAALPLLVESGDGSPVRAVLRTLS